MSDMARHIACIGAGNIGRAWAIVFARAGYRVSVYDPSGDALEHARKMLAVNLESLLDAAEIDSDVQLLERIQLTGDLSNALLDAVHVQECAPERLDLKRSLFQQLDAACEPQVTLASSTSELLPSTFLDVTRAPERCLVAHPVNPPYLIPLVELCPGPAASSETMDKAARLFESCGMTAIRMQREINGFLLNRLQAAVLGEAWHLVAEGYCTPRDIDRVMTEGLGRRWAFLGPLETGHLNAKGGYRDYIDALGPAWTRLNESIRGTIDWSDDVFEHIADELERDYPVAQVPDAQAWRDQRLIALAQHLRDQPRYRR